MNEQISRVKEKIDQLKNLDANYSIFGSQSHRYKANPTISIDKIRQFEDTYKIALPKGYVEFLTKIGNGGVGPFYGLEPLNNVLFSDLDYKKSDSLLHPSQPFLHTEPWNLKFEPTVDEDENEEQYENERTEFDETYFDEQQMNGTIAICNYGCAISLNLVVNGQEYGNIWTDDRASDNGIYPSQELGNKEKMKFLDWYELWLDNSIKEIKEKKLLSNESNAHSRMQQEKPWWKFWENKK